MAAGQESLIQQISLCGGLHGREIGFLGDTLRTIHIAVGVLPSTRAFRETALHAPLRRGYGKHIRPG